MFVLQPVAQIKSIARRQSVSEVVIKENILMEINVQLHVPNFMIRILMHVLRHAHSSMVQT